MILFLSIWGSYNAFPGKRLTAAHPKRVRFTINNKGTYFWYVVKKKKNNQVHSIM